jgi:hypothetical protein
MKEYHKINTIFKRHPETAKIIIGDWSEPEFEYLANNDWVFTEKVDGTNIRVRYDGNDITYAGKTDRAQIPTFLLDRLHTLFDSQLNTFGYLFCKEGEVLPQVCLYGEGYGNRIQGNGKQYSDTQDFVLFDVWINGWWLMREAVESIADQLGIRVVPIIGHGTLQDCIDIVKQGFTSQWGDFRAEGIVARPVVELQTRAGKRIITKIKYRDYKETPNEI